MVAVSEQHSFTPLTISLPPGRAVKKLRLYATDVPQRQIRCYPVTHRLARLRAVRPRPA